jgi:hypothetical protein
VGRVDTRKLQAERVDVQFEGVGDISVYASDLLNAVAKGIGGLTYYGHPKKSTRTYPASAASRPATEGLKLPR